MRFRYLTLAVFLLAGCQAGEDVAQRILVTQCGKDDATPESTIAACTALIDKPLTTTETRVFALGSRADAHAKRQDVEKAMADLDKLLALAPNHALALGRRGSLRGGLGQIDAAITDLEASIAADPKRFETHSDLGTAYEYSGQYEKSLAAYERALAINPDAWIAVGGRCWVRAVLNRDLDAAAADCGRTLVLKPDDFNAYNSRGFVRFRQGRYDDAITDYDRALAGTQTGSSYYVRGLARRALGRTADGDADIAKAKTLEPGVAERYARFGVTAP
jgi:tetratricopeptide (TPR) repeat protein